MPFPVDSHVHSEWSWDTPVGDMERSCARAVELGLRQARELVDTLTAQALSAFGTPTGFAAARTMPAPALYRLSVHFGPD